MATLLRSVEAILARYPEDDWRAELARTLATQLDERPQAAMARELRQTLTELEASIEPDRGFVDELRARRAARIAAAQFSPDPLRGDAKAGTGSESGPGLGEVP